MMSIRYRKEQKQQQVEEEPETARETIVIDRTGIAVQVDTPKTSTILMLPEELFKFIENAGEEGPKKAKEALKKLLSARKEINRTEKDFVKIGKQTVATSLAADWIDNAIYTYLLNLITNDGGKSLTPYAKKRLGLDDPIIDELVKRMAAKRLGKDPRDVKKHALTKTLRLDTELTPEKVEEAVRKYMEKNPTLKLEEVRRKVWKLFLEMEKYECDLGSHTVVRERFVERWREVEVIDRVVVPGQSVETPDIDVLEDEIIKRLKETGRKTDAFTLPCLRVYANHAYILPEDADKALPVVVSGEEQEILENAIEEENKEIEK